MSSKKLLQDANNVKILSDKLSKCKYITRFDKKDEPEAWTLALAFNDLEDSFRKILDELFPKLIQKELNDSEIKNLLLEIGEEFRHILYHIKDTEFYNYLFEEE